MQILTVCTASGIQQLRLKKELASYSPKAATKTSSFIPQFLLRFLKNYYVEAQTRILKN